MFEAPVTASAGAVPRSAEGASEPALGLGAPSAAVGRGLVGGLDPRGPMAGSDGLAPGELGVDGPLALLGEFRGVVDRLVGLEWSRLAGGVLLDVVRELEVQKRRLAGVDQALLAQLGLRH
ncbi:MAG: hypothetical protein FWD74_12280, partial [Actinomycetia bacterium]|nr:hypothetical protein [Actinomycetes bacterium]